MNTAVLNELPRVLLVEDSLPIRQRLHSLVTESGLARVVAEASSVKVALAEFERMAPDAVVLDLQLTDGTGYALLDAIKRSRPSCKVIVMTNFAEPETRERCLQQGADHFLEKSTDFELVPALLAGHAWHPVAARTAAVAATPRSRVQRHDAEQHYRHVMESVAAAVYTCDAQGRVTFYNAAAAELWGQEPVIGEARWGGAWRKFSPDGQTLRVDQGPMAQAVRSGQANRGREVIIERPDGTRRHVLTHPQPLFDAAGTLTGAVNMLVDITPMRLAEAAREQAQEVARQALDASRDTTWLWERGTGTLRFDADLAKLLGVSVSAAPAQDTQSLDFLLRQVRQADRSRIAMSLAHAPDKADSLYEDFEVVDGDGQLRHFVLKGGAITSGSPAATWLAGTLRDVSSRVRTQQELSRTAETLERMCNIARIGAWEADIGSGRMRLSAVAREIHGISPDEPLPLWLDFRGAFQGDAVLRLQAAKRRLLEHGEGYDLVLPISLIGGGNRWVRSVVSPHFEDGALIRVDGAVQDVTSLVEAQARVSVLNSRARMLAEAVATSSQLVLVTDRDERITWCNDAFVKVSGWTLEEVLGKKPGTLLQRATVPEAVNALMRRRIHARQTFEGIRLQNFSKGGQPYWVDLEVRPMYDDAGELEGFVGVQTDVTRDIEREQALVEATRRVDRATENAAIGLWELDLSTHVARWNGQMFEKFGFESAHGPPSDDAVWATLHEEDRQSSRRDFLRHATDPIAARWRGEFRVCKLAGGWRWLRSECAFERAEDGRALRALGTTVDVTAEHEAVDERAARAEADARNLAKTAFLSRMSHELRTPLNAVIGYAQLLVSGETPLPKAALERIKRIERSGWHLLALIDDVLDLSRIESNAMSVTPVSLSLSDVAKEAAVLVEPRVLQMGLTLDIDLPPLWVHADATRVQQILSNLLSNAVKYNRPGGSVSVRLHRQDGMACVEVADTGLGLTAEQQAMLFEPFNRLGREYSSIEGTGIGLSIARALATLMGGDITASSVAGQGSVFTLCLPLAEHGAQTVEPDQTASAPLQDCTLDVLCVEDNEVNAMVLEESIRRLWPSWTVRQAATASAALDALRQAPCDLMLLDINLPDQTGLQMLAQAQLEGLITASQTVVLSADVMPETRRAAGDAGITQFLDKPFRLSDLKRILEQAARSAAD